MSNKRKLDRAPDPAPDDRSTAVSVAYVHTDEVDYNFFFSYFHLLAHDLASEGRVWRGGPIAMYGGTDGLSHSRNTAVKGFLADDKADWLWWVDTDMGFAPDTVDQLFASADPAERPVVGALCFAALHDDEDGAGGWRDVYTPVVMDWVHSDDATGFAVRWDYPRDTVTRCAGTGSACILVHRSVYERVRAGYDDPEWSSWYSKVINPATGQLVSEDLSFCLRLMQAGIPVHVNTAVQTTHAKRLWLSQDDYWRQRALNPPPVPAAEMAEGAPIPVAAPTWTVPRYAVIPTHNRPARLLALVVSLGAQCDHIVIVDNASTPPVDQAHLQASVPEHCTVEVIRDEEQPPNLSRIWNVMFDRCARWRLGEPGDWARPLEPEKIKWDVAVFNDDSVVPTGWYNTVATALREHETAAVAHTGDRPIREPYLLTNFDFPRSQRMAPHAFVVRGELRLHSDESMQWWYFDDDFSRQAIQAGGVLGVPGPVVLNSAANTSTVGVLREQTEKDRAAFEAKWGAP